MVLEKIINVSMIEDKPAYAIVLGIIFSTIGLVVGWLIFPNDASIVAIMFTAIASLPFIRKVIYIEEKGEERAHTLKQLIIRNKKIIEIFSLFFIGVAISYLLWYTVLPELARNTLFLKQTAVFSNQGAVLGQFVNRQTQFLNIFSHNLKILLFCIVLSLLYGSGAIVILVWNASVLGVFIFHLGKLEKIIRLIPYASLEFIAFFLAAIAGGILSVGIERHRTSSKLFKNILFDSIFLFCLAIIILTISAVLEVHLLL
ncbi:MAG: stage II sporulation protein M [Candidatus Woesearchaeota archaeon]|nr:MAG: stage II sporulation protein M [Candidatus Woesearchaeota archaeon]